MTHRNEWLVSEAHANPVRVPLEAAPKPITIDLARTGILVIDMQNDFRPDRLNLSPALRHVYDPAGRGQGLGDRLHRTGAAVLQAGSPSARIVAELAPPDSDIRVDKHRMSGFWDTPLDAILRNLRLDTLLFGGVNLDQCVLHTVADANFLGYDTILVEDCAATTNPDFCREATLLNIRQIFGFTVRSGALLQSLPT
jgi:nicotinamidase-related amidase